MNQSNNDTSNSEFSVVPSRATEHLLRESVAEQPRPVDCVLDRFEDADAGSWLEEFLEEWIPRRLGLDAQKLVAGLVPRESLALARKQLAQEQRPFGEMPSPEGVLAYFVLNAVAVVHAGALLSSREPEEFLGVFCDLAAAPHKAIRELFDKAAASLASSS